MPTLSICIPTYRRAPLLAELLRSIVPQLQEGVEVVVGDDASGDETPRVVEAFKADIPSLKFIQQSRNIGLDENFITLVNRASGEYIWFMGDDDRVEPDGIATVLDHLIRWPGVTGLTLGAIDYDHAFQTPVGLRATPPTMRLHGTDAVFTKLVDLLGFISTLVVRRDLWRSVCREDPIGDYKNYYLQVYILGRMIDRAGSWGIVNHACVGFRTDNDQFKSRYGWVGRMNVDIVAYDQIIMGLFPTKPSLRRQIRKRIFHTHIMARIRNAKAARERTPDLGKAANILFRRYKDLPEFWYAAVPMLLLHDSMVRALRTAYQRFSPTSGLHRAKRYRASTAGNYVPPFAGGTHPN